MGKKQQHILIKVGLLHHSLVIYDIFKIEKSGYKSNCFFYYKIKNVPDINRQYLLTFNKAISIIKMYYKEYRSVG